MTRRNEEEETRDAAAEQHLICRRITTNVVEAAALGDLENPKPREEEGAADSQNMVFLHHIAFA